LLRPHIGFGVNTLLFSSVMAVQKQLPILAFNHLFGTLAVSLWSMSERLSRFPKIGAAGPFSRVTMVSMSRQWNDGLGAADAGKTYLASSRLLAILLFPGLIIAAFHARPVFVWLLSDPWGDVAPLFGLAVPALLAELVSSIGAKVFMAANRTDLRLRMSLERLVLGTAFFLLALPWGLEVAIGVRSLFAILYMPRYWHYMNKCVPLSIKAEALALLLPICVGLAAAILGIFIRAPWHVSALLNTAIVFGLCFVATGITVLLAYRQIGKDAAWLRKST
jgi:O-antigen/teichoic acid export membrane protein